MLTVKTYSPGASPVNYQVEEGTELGEFLDDQGISVDGGFRITVNSVPKDNNYLLEDQDKIVITRSEIKGGLQ